MQCAEDMVADGVLSSSPERVSALPLQRLSTSGVLSVAGAQTKRQQHRCLVAVGNVTADIDAVKLK